MAASMFRGGYYANWTRSSDNDIGVIERRRSCVHAMIDLEIESSSHDVCNSSNANIIYNDPICLDLRYSGSLKPKKRKNAT